MMKQEKRYRIKEFPELKEKVETMSVRQLIKQVICPAFSGAPEDCTINF